MSETESIHPPAFEHLTYDLVISLTENALGQRCTNLCRPLNSYINRVYEVQLDSGDMVVAKFFRPGRWSREVLRDEQVFLFELHAAEVPVIVPFGNGPENVLHEHEGMSYALYPKKGGRVCDEPTAEQWKQLGHLIGRMHQVGAAGTAQYRVTMHPTHSASDNLEHILSSGFMASDFASAYEKTARNLIERITPLFENTELIRIHGDLHQQNVIDRPGESFTLIDFDDMAMGPVVQDIWMLLPGRVADTRRELDILLEGYELFFEIDNTQMLLIEPLRAMRYLHYTAWCVHQAEDGGITRLSPDWGTPGYWYTEIGELEKQRIEIEDVFA